MTTPNELRDPALRVTEIADEFTHCGRHADAKYLRTLAAQLPAAPTLDEACEPWRFSTGELPAYDSPLSGVFCAGMAYSERLLAAALGVENYEGGDGSEDFDTDATNTLLNILAAAGIYDRDECRFAKHAPAARLGDREVSDIPGARWHASDDLRRAARLLSHSTADQD